VTYRNDDGRERQDIIRHGGIAQFDEATLDRVTDSDHDDNTIRVLAKIADEQTQLGHIPRDVSADLASQMDAGYKWRAIITRVAGFPTMGVSLMLYRMRQ
jgi:hypothetical protein